MGVSSIGIGIIGCGLMGGRHALALAAVRGVRVVAVNDIDPTAAHRLAERVGAAVVAEGPTLVARADVELQNPRNSSGGDNLLRNGFGILTAAMVVHHDVITIARQAQRDGLANSTARAGDQDGFAHSSLPLI